MEDIGYASILGLRFTTALAALCLSACVSADSAPTQVVQVQDSLGVRVFSYAPASDTVVLTSPDLTIGNEAREETQFFNALSAMALADGRILVVNGGTNELRYFAADGRFLDSFGGDGDGPGDFQLLSLALRMSGDTILVYDVFSRLITTVGPDGRYVRSSRPEGLVYRPTDLTERPLAYIPPWMVGLLADGSPLFEGPTIFPYSKIGVAAHAWAVLAVHDIRLGMVDTIRTFFTQQYVPVDANGRVRPVMTPMLPANAVRTAGAGIVAVSEEGRRQFSVFDRGGNLIAVARENAPRTVVTPEHVKSYRRKIELRLTSEPWLGTVPAPDSVPAYDRAIVDDQGRIWAREYEVSRTNPESWRLLPLSEDSGGLVLVLPARFDMTDVRGDVVVGLSTDALGVQQVLRFSCHACAARSGRPGG